jgi:hypothetical protein
MFRAKFLLVQNKFDNNYFYKQPPKLPQPLFYWLHTQVITGIPHPSNTTTSHSGDNSYS